MTKSRDLSGLVNGADGELITWDSSGDPTVVGVGTAGQVLTSGGVGVAPTMQTVTPNEIVQVVNVQDGAVATGTTVTPQDDTIPQNTEGNEIMTLAITPTNASNILLIEVQAVATHTVNTTDKILALFQDATSDALAATGQGGDASRMDTLSLVHKMVAGTTSATTFKVRAGTAEVGTLTFNGNTSTRRYGGVSASSITITEIKV